MKDQKREIFCLSWPEENKCSSEKTENLPEVALEPYL